MKKRPGLVLALVVVGLALVPFGRWLALRSEVRALGDALVADVAQAVKAKVTRTPPPKMPSHDNGFQCLAAMLEVKPRDVSAFEGAAATAFEPFGSGARPMSELPGELQDRMRAASPWMTSLRDCGRSLMLQPVRGLALGAASPARADLAGEALATFTRVEVRALLADGQPGLAVERCTDTWAVLLDLTHLGLQGAEVARAGVRATAPACAEALARIPPATRPEVGKAWAELTGRVAPARDVLERERLAHALATYAWVLSPEQRAQLPAVVEPAGASVLVARQLSGEWRAWDDAMRALIAVAGGAPAERQAAAANDALGPTTYEAQLTRYAELPGLLTLLARLADGGELPAGAVRREREVEFAGLVLPAP